MRIPLPVKAAARIGYRRAMMQAAYYTKLANYDVHVLNGDEVEVVGHNGGHWIIPVADSWLA